MAVFERGTQMVLRPRGWLVVAGVMLLSACPGDEPAEHVCEPGTSDLLYPLEEGNWWRHQVIDAEDKVVQDSDKVVYVEALEEVDRRPGTVAYRVVRDQPDGGYWHRWQQVDGASILRHVDEKFDADGNTLELKFNCPYKLRLLPEEGYFENSYSTITIEAVDDMQGEPAEDYQDCFEGVTADESCVTTPADLGTLPDYCDVTTADSVKVWENHGVESTHAKYLEKDFDAFRVTKADLDDPTGDVDTFWWVRGLGKIKEDSDEEEVEHIVDCCVAGIECEQSRPNTNE